MNEQRAVSMIIPIKEKFSFSLALGGQNVFYGLMISFLMIFYTDILGITAASVGVLFLVARTWDAVNDPVMGLIADRTRSQYGKFRPWLLWTPIPIAVFSVLCFTAPDLSMTGKLIWAYVTYIGWGMCYTMCDIPFWALTSAMTRDTQQRTTLLSMAQIFALIGIFVPTIFAVPIVEAFQGGSAGYFRMVLILTLVSAPLMTLAFFGTKERVEATPERLTLKKTVRIVIKNRPMLIIILSGLLASLAMIAQTSQMYFVTYNLGDAGLMAVLGGIAAPGIMAGVIVTPILTKKLGKVKVFIVSGILRFVLSLVFFLMVGYDNLTLVFLFIGLSVACWGPALVLPNVFFADSVDYTEWLTGERVDGVIFSFRTFLAKITSAIGGLVGGLILTWIGYVPNATQSPEALQGIFAMMTVIPALGTLLSVIPFFFYPLTDKKHAAIVKELEVKKNKGK
ncbi:MAG: MFS transporter [Proteobacteria bacterium]|nr:MFS transporter [Pseudomonadota bacterium]